MNIYSLIVLGKCHRHLFGHRCFLLPWSGTRGRHLFGNLWYYDKQHSCNVVYVDDTATNLGSAMDELMRHQPTLKSDAMAGIVKLLQQLCEMGRDPKCTVNTQNEASRSDMEQSSGGHERQGNLGTTTDDEDEDDIPRDAVNSQRASPQPEAG